MVRSGDGDGKEDWMGEWRVVGSHSLQFRMSLDKSVTDSDIYPHSLGHGFPPKEAESNEEEGRTVDGSLGERL